MKKFFPFHPFQWKSFTIRLILMILTLKSSKQENGFKIEDFVYLSDLIVSIRMVQTIK